MNSQSLNETISSILGKAVKEVQEWAKVFFVIPVIGRCTFVSKAKIALSFIVNLTSMRGRGKIGYVACIDWKSNEKHFLRAVEATHGSTSYESYEIKKDGIYVLQDAAFGSRKTRKEVFVAYKGERYDFDTVEDAILWDNKVDLNGWDVKAQSIHQAQYADDILRRALVQIMRNSSNSIAMAKKISSVKRILSAAAILDATDLEGTLLRIIEK